MRTTWKVLIVLLLLVFALGYAFTGTPTFGRKVALRDAPVTSIELSWLSTRREIKASNVCSEVLHTLQKARDGGPVHLCPVFGTLIIHYADGTTNGFALMPGHRINRLDLVDVSGSGMYSISMGEMFGTLESVGLLTKDRK